MAKVVAEVAEGFDGAHGVFISGGNQRGKRGIVCNGAQTKTGVLLEALHRYITAVFIQDVMAFQVGG